MLRLECNQSKHDEEMAHREEACKGEETSDMSVAVPAIRAGREPCGTFREKEAQRSIEFRDKQ